MQLATPELYRALKSANGREEAAMKDGHNLTSDEWKVIQELVRAGEQESPWSWATDWPEGFDGVQTEAVAAKFDEFVKEQVAGD